MTAELRPPARPRRAPAVPPGRGAAPAPAAGGAAAGTAPAARRAPATAPRGEARPTPGLALVDRRSQRQARLRRTLLTGFTGVLVLTLFAVGLVHAQLVQRQQRLDELRTEIADLRGEQLRLSREVLVASSPDEIVRRAIELGMVRAEEPVYLVAVRPAEGG